MKKLIPYVVLVLMTIYSLWVSFTWDIPVDNQIVMFVLSCLSFGFLLLMIFDDIRYYIKSKKSKPQTF